MAESTIQSMADILAAHPLFAGLDPEITEGIWVKAAED